MKKIIYYLPVLFFLLSCTQEEEPLYSCNPSINLAIKENISVAENLKRSEWLLLQESYKIPVYRTFSNAKKLLFWKEKFAEVKKLKWSSEELKHIESAEKFMYEYPEILSCSTASDEILNKRDLFMHEWIKYAENELHWNKSIIVSIVACGNKVINTKGYIEVVRKGKYFHHKYRNFNAMLLEDSDTLAVDTTDYNIPSDVDTIGLGDKFTCHCNAENLIDFCPIGTMCDSRVIPCEGTDSGCGWFLGEACTGLCL